MIIYIVTSSYFNDRDKERFGVNFFIEKGLKVVILDVQDYTNPELKFLANSEYKEEEKLYVIKCSNFRHVKNTIDLHGTGVAILFLSENIESTKIRRYLKKSKVKIGVLHGGMLPTLKDNTNVSNKIVAKFKSLNLNSFLTLICNRLYSKVFSPKRYDFLITSNYDKSIENYNINRPKSIIETHCLDYDLYIKHKNDESLIENKYAVFLDQNLLKHTDFIRSNKKLDISSKKYYAELNNLFSIIENKFNYEVIIAAHPRANTDDYKILFDNRKIICGQSHLLVKYCEFSITHYSTSINFAVIYEKPILYITSNDLIDTVINKFITHFSSTLHQNLINISNIALPLEININKEYYSKYKYDYIKKNDLESLSWDIFYNTYIKKFI
jgi:hypothetical protein